MDSMNELMIEARDIIKSHAAAIDSAYYYRSRLVSFMAATHQVLVDVLEEFSLYEKIKALADSAFLMNHKLDEKEKKKINAAVEKNVGAIMSKMSERARQRITKHRPWLDAKIAEKGLNA